MPASERVLPALRRAESFDEVAELYASARPSYPDALVTDLMALTGLRKTHRVLEIGAGTGQLTLSLARQGFRLIAIERGTNLARLLAKNIAPSPRRLLLSLISTSGMRRIADSIPSSPLLLFTGLTLPRVC